MSIVKQYLKTKPVCKVTFVVEAKESKEINVVGDFNNWTPKAYGLKKLKSGVFKGTFNLPKDKSYEFKYLVDGEYVNEVAADRYLWNDYAGSENSVLDL